MNRDSILLEIQKMNSTNNKANKAATNRDVNRANKEMATTFIAVSIVSV